MTFPENAPQPPQWSNFSDASAHVASRGLIGHVPIIAILLIVQGVSEILFGLFCFAFAALVHWGPEKELAGMRGIGLLLAGIGVPCLIIGVLRIVAGVYNYHYCRRGLGVTALACGLFTLITGYCAPTAIALAIYGLIVYLDEAVIAAFRMGDSGRPRSEIRNAYFTRQ